MKYRVCETADGFIVFLLASCPFLCTEPGNKSSPNLGLLTRDRETDQRVFNIWTDQSFLRTNLAIGKLNPKALSNSLGYTMMVLSFQANARVKKRKERKRIVYSKQS